MGEPKKLLTGAVGVLLVLLLIEGGRLVSADDSIVIELNGQPLQLANQPLLEGDTVYVPVRGLAEAVQASVYWERLNNRIWLLHEGRAESLELAANPAENAPAEGAPSAFAREGAVYMPLRSLAELLGLESAWSPESGIVSLSSRAAASEPPIEISLDQVVAGGGDVVWLKSGGSYVIRGSLPEGRLRIQTSEPVSLRLEACRINNSSGAAVYAEGGGLVRIEAAGSAPSVLSSAGAAAVEVGGALELGGGGSLEIAAAGGSGIRAGNYVRLAGAAVDIRAADYGVYAAELILAESGKLRVNAGGTGLAAAQRVFINGGEITVKEAECGVSTEHIVAINGGSLNIKAAGAGICAGAAAYNILAGVQAEPQSAAAWPPDGVTVVVSLDNEADNEEAGAGSIANIASGELNREQHIAINGGELVVCSGGAALLSQGSVEQQGGVAVLYAAKSRALAAGGVAVYDGGTLLAADGSAALGASALNGASGGSWLEIEPEQPLPPASELKVADKSGQTVWSYQAVGEVARLVFADSHLEPEAVYQLLLNGEPYGEVCAQ